MNLSQILKKVTLKQFSKLEAKKETSPPPPLAHHEKFEYEKFCDIVHESNVESVLGKYRCTLCGKRFIKETRLQQHMTVRLKSQGENL